MFLKLDKIAEKLDQIFATRARGHEAFATKGHGSIYEAQKSLGVDFTAKFTKLLSKFDLGEFEIYNVSFGTRSDYASELIA